MLLSLLLILFGLALLVFGADLLIRGVSALAVAAGIPPVVIGLTVVAFGTSLPEFVVNSTAAFHGQTALAFGNIVGSSSINIGWVLALTAVIRPLTVRPSIVTREIPMMILAALSFLVLSSDHLLSHASVSQLDRADGLMLLLLFAVFLYYTARDVLSAPAAKRAADPFIQDATESVEHRPKKSSWLYIAMTVAGIIAVAAGGRFTVSAAVNIAHHLGIPEVIIGLTIISFGTTLPELTTGILAVRRGESDIAIGNVVGSNIFNLLFVGGTVSTVHPIPLPAGSYLDLLVLAGLSVALLPIARRGPLKVTRAEGVLLLITYLSYTLWRTFASQPA